MNTADTPVYEWADLNWRAIEKQVTSSKSASIKPHSVARSRQSTDYRGY